jgi:hypothetical protein
VDLDRLKFVSMYHVGHKLFSVPNYGFDILRDAESGDYLYDYRKDLAEEVQIYRPSIIEIKNGRRFWIKRNFYSTGELCRVIYCCDLIFSNMQVVAVASVGYLKDGRSLLKLIPLYLSQDERDAVIKYVMEKKV